MGIVPILADVVRYRRNAAGLALRDIEGPAGLGRSNLWRFEAGQARAVRDLDGLIDGYAEALGVQPIDLWREALASWESEARR